MKKTNITVEMVYVTPELAQNYLRFNNANRKFDSNHGTFLASQMRKNLWIENGESIVFDENHELKDGQHRLRAIVISEKSYFFPVVRNVKPESMATIDTGKNRTSGDVLQLNGFKNGRGIASFIAILNKYHGKKSKASGGSGGGNKRQSLTNQEVLAYCQDNYDNLNPIFNKIASIAKSQSPIRFFSNPQLFIILYLIAGYNPKQEHYKFLSYLCGINRQSGTATDYLFAKISNSKIKKEPLNFYWILGMSLKAWNYYADGNPSLKYYQFSVDSELPKALEIKY